MTDEQGRYSQREAAKNESDRQSRVHALERAEWANREKIPDGVIGSTPDFGSGNVGSTPAQGTPKWHEFKQRRETIWGRASAKELAVLDDEQARAKKLWDAMVVVAGALLSTPNQSKIEPWTESPEGTARCAKRVAQALLTEWEKGNL